MTMRDAGFHEILMTLHRLRRSFKQMRLDAPIVISLEERDFFALESAAQHYFRDYLRADMLVGHSFTIDGIKFEARLKRHAEAGE